MRTAPGVRRRRLTVPGTLLMSALAVIAHVVASPIAGAKPGVPVASDRCTAEQRTESLRADQQRVFDLLGPLRTLNGPEDLVPLAAAGTYGPDSHGWVQYERMGVALLDLNQALQIIGKQMPGMNPGRDTVVSGKPAGLFYRSRQTGFDYHDAVTPAFPYDLVGWFYAGVYTPGETPNEVGLCMFRGDWAFHERGVHTFPKFDMYMMPPQEDYLGQKRGDTPLPGGSTPSGLVHPRGWDVHIFLDPSNPTTPVATDLSPFGDIPGVVGGMDTAFPYPVWPDELEAGADPHPVTPGMTAGHSHN
ncbi:hypothetical protein [Nocardia salmonicida]|uniref:hypothetical protein n=1 Tax=Nocardia salmonicida TaxID=53431 RepID=UPI001C3FB945|nr:hypothetical protein [Nocardia salmonicida]